MPKLETKPPLPYRGATQIEAAGAVESTTDLTAITANATTYQWGSWLQLLASSAKKAFGLMVQLEYNQAASFRVQISTGASGSEVAVADFTLVAGSVAALQDVNVGPFFIQIPAGTAISARCMATVASYKVNVGVLLFEVED